MKEYKYQMICSDLDGTLLMPDKTLSPKTRDIMKRLTEQGVYFVPTTGRAFFSIPEEVLEFPGLKYAIVSNGAAIYDLQTKTPVVQYPLEESFAEKLFQYLREKEEHVTYECFVHGKPYTSQKYFNDPSDFGIPGDREKNYVQSTRTPVPDIQEFTIKHSAELDALDVILLPEDRDRLSEDIRSHFNGIYITTSVTHLIEISHENSGKHQTMSALAALLNLSMDQVIAFGDGDNDSEMLLEAGLGVAVENASERCKKAADIIIGPSYDESVAMFLTELFQKNVHQ